MPSPRSPLAVLPVSVFLILLITLTAGCTGLIPVDHGSSLRENTTGDLRVYFLDVGQGDSSVILFRDKAILIDAGEVDAGDRVVGYLRKLGVRKIDLLVATHPHSDHIGGMQDVLAAFPVGKVLDAGIPSSSPLYERFLRTVDGKDIPYVVAKPGLTHDPDPSLRILVLSPPDPAIGDDVNADSIVLRVSYGTVNLLLTGDATAEAEERMLRAGYPLEADVIKVSHHGSSDAGSPSFLYRVDPEVAVISLARDNEYGHPHRETLERLAVTGARVFRTDSDGTVLVRSDGATYSVATENGNRDIWSQGTTIPTGTTAAAPVSPVTPGTTVPAAPFTLPVTLPPSPAGIEVPPLTIPPVPSGIPVPSLTLPSLQVGNASSVYISAVQFNAPGDDTVNLNGEWVRLASRGDGPVLLTGWTLADRSSAEPYRFPAFLLLPGNTVTVYTGSGVLNDTALFMGRTEPLWGNSGDRALLRDGSGTIIDQREEGAS